MKKKNVKLLLLATILIICFVVFTACGKKEKTNDSNRNTESNSSDNSQNNSNNNNSGKGADMKELKELMLAKDTTLPEMSVVYGSDENAVNLFSYLAEYDYENVADYFFSYAAAGTAEEVAVIRLNDAKNASACLEAVKKHVESRIIQFQTYDPSQVKRCEKAIVFSNENYVVLIIADRQAEIKDAFYNYFNN